MLHDSPLTIDKIQAVLPPEHGTISSFLKITRNRYQLKTELDTFLLTVFVDSDLEKLPFFLDFTTALAAAGLPFPRPVFSIRLDNTQALVLSTFTAGRELRDPTPAVCFHLGKLLGMMHRIGSTFDAKPASCRQSLLQPEVLEPLLAILPTTDALLLQEEMGYQKTLDFHLFPQGIIHGHLTLQNVLFQEQTIAAVVDFTHFCTDNLLLDVGIAANSWCLEADGTASALLMESLLAGYQAERALTALEQQHWQDFRRTGAFYCWVMSLLSFHLPNDGYPLMLHPQDYRKVLAGLSLVPKI